MVNKLFINDKQKDQMVQKVLYGNICEDYEEYMQCPVYIKKNLDRLYEKYGQCIKNIKILETKLINAQKTAYGTLDTSTF